MWRLCLFYDHCFVHKFMSSLIQSAKCGGENIKVTLKATSSEILQHCIILNRDNDHGLKKHEALNKYSAPNKR